jgi:hypothetical protein
MKTLQCDHEPKETIYTIPNQYEVKFCAECMLIFLVMAMKYYNGMTKEEKSRFNQLQKALA